MLNRPRRARIAGLGKQSTACSVLWFTFLPSNPRINRATRCLSSATYLQVESHKERQSSVRVTAEGFSSPCLRVVTFALLLDVFVPNGHMTSCEVSSPPAIKIACESGGTFGMRKLPVPVRTPVNAMTLVCLLSRVLRSRVLGKSALSRFLIGEHSQQQREALSVMANQFRGGTDCTSKHSGTLPNKSMRSQLPPVFSG
jgi:hypothetical protein